MHNTRIFRGVEQLAAVPPTHRGIAYGDGVFETMRIHRGVVHWWDAHWARLAHGAQRLRLALPAQQFARLQAAALCAGIDDGVLKLILSREGERGYAASAGAAPLWMMGTHAPGQLAPSTGLRLRWCTTRLGIQPALAGIKHCNRLEQVLARAEWNDPHANDRDAEDGLLLDMHGNVICATAANVFVLRDGRWATPLLDHGGVAGICRAWLLQALAAREARLSAVDVESADAIFLCNAVRGILPVARLGRCCWESHSAVAAARRLLAQAHPAFALESP